MATLELRDMPDNATPRDAMECMILSACVLFAKTNGMGNTDIAGKIADKFMSVLDEMAEGWLQMDRAQN